MDLETTVKSDGAIIGPYRATKIWNSLIRAFRKGVPVGRRRRYMRTHNNCFVASEAVDFMHNYVKNNKNFSPDVTRQQIVMLLRKLQKARIFEDICDSKSKHMEFSDNNKLYRKISGFPVKDARIPLQERMDILNAMPAQKDQLKSAEMPKCRLVVRPLSAAEMESVWKKMTLYRLQKTIGVHNLDDILDYSLVNGRNIMHNCLFVSKSGLVTNIESKDHLPHWVLQAMKCLAHWPNNNDDSLPCYPGFEKDVFRVVCEYFQNLPEPLLTYEMYEVFTNILVMADNSHACHSSPNTDCSTIPSLSSFGSFEKFLIDLTPFKPTSHTSARLYPSISSVNLQHATESFSEDSGVGHSSRFASTGSIPVKRYETAFGPDNKTVTRVYYYSNEESASRLSGTFHQVKTKDTTASTSSKWMSEGNVNDMCSNTLQILKSYDGRKATFSEKPPTGPSRKSFLLGCDRNKRSLSKSDINLNGGEDRSTAKDSWYKTNHYSAMYCPVVQQTEPRVWMQPADVQKSKSLQNYQNRRKSDLPANCSTSKTSGRSTSLSDIFSHASQSKDGKRFYSSSDVKPLSTEERMRQALQLSLLLLPPANRRKLHLLLRMLHRLRLNKELKLADSQPLHILVIEKFYRSILDCQEESDMDELLATQLVTFLVRHYELILAIPKDLKCIVEEQLTQMQRVQVVYSDNDALNTAFCQQIPVTEYEKQKVSNSEWALEELLDNLIKNQNMPVKEKRRKLQEFQRVYPGIYDRYFSKENREPPVFPMKPKIKQSQRRFKLIRI